MKDQELQILQRYFPEAAIPMIVEAYSQSRFNLRFKRPRSSKLGDFRTPRGSSDLCTITLNKDLNPYQMLVTFVHEYAHYMVFVQYHLKRLDPHGREWKEAFTRLLLPYLKPEIFPQEVIEALRTHLEHIKASSTADQNLAKVMKRYDRNPTQTLVVEDLPLGAVFKLQNGMTFQKGPKRRTRYQCVCLSNGKEYSVSGIAQTIPLQNMEK